MSLAPAHPVTHVVLFGLTDPADAPDVAARFAALEQECVRGGERYILSIEGGSQSSTEEPGEAWTVGFIMRFATESDRDFYVGGEDAAHESFKNYVGPLLAPAGVAVFDFTDGVITS